MDELSDGTTQRWLTEEDHPLQALALDRQNKPFDVSVQIRRTVRQPNDVRSGVLEQIAKLRVELLPRAPSGQTFAMKVLGVIPARAKAPVEERSRYCKPTISITGFPREGHDEIYPRC